MGRWYKYDPNPVGSHDAMDCTVRALCAALGIDWDWAYCLTAAEGFADKKMPIRNGTWWKILRRRGFKRAIIPNSCPDCYTAEDFCRDHPLGVFVLGFDAHTAAVIDGYVWDAWDSTQELPLYFWYREGENYV